ncbi:MAG: type IV toxin-antitoxin system AbiEi family antitoxin domain-containing protein [Solirubrobacterales bacterium]
MSTRADPLELRTALHELAASQGGYFTAQQALAVGYSYPAQHYHANRGAWERVDRGIYRVKGWPLPEHPELIRWTLWSGGAGVVSHQSALSVHELGDFLPVVVHLTLPTTSRRKATGAEIHLADLPPADVEQHGGFRVTTPLRSLLDTAAVGVDIDQLATAIADALERGTVATGELRRRSDQFGATPALAIERALAEVERR